MTRTALVAAVLAAVAVSAQAQTPLERGTYLERSIVACGNCHTPKGPPAMVAGKELAGGFEIPLPFGIARVPNITPDKETGIGNWTDEQIIAGIRHGVRPDGSTIGPPMPIEFYKDMSDNEVKAIVAYVRSVKPVSNKVAKSEYKIPLPPPHGPAPTNVSAPPKSNKVAYGAYLSGPVAHCMDCHTPLDKGRRDMTRVGSGGFEMDAPGGGVITTPNLTPDPDTGIGRWSDADIKRAVREGVRPNDAQLVPIMAFGAYRNMSEEDMDAIIAYLRSLKPIKTVAR
jgi:mono/diheme cytochrome c family protein